MNLKYDDLVIANPKGNGEVYTLLEEPTENESGQGGLFFALVEINLSPEINQRIVSVFDEVKQKYYQLCQKEEQNTDISENLEQILAKTNHKLTAIIEDNLKSFDIRDLNFVIGALKGKTLVLSQLGRTRAFLLHKIGITEKDKTKKATTRYKVIDILESAEGTLGTNASLQIFSNIINGSIGNGDTIVLCNESFTDYLSLDKIKKTATTLPIKSATEMLKNALTEVDAPVNFASLIIKTGPEKEIVQEKSIVEVEKTSDSHDSVERLIKTEEKTEKLLTPSIKPSLKKAWGAISGIMEKKKLKVVRGKTHPPIPDTSYSHRKKSLPASAVKKLLDLVKNSFATIGKIFTYIIKGGQKTVTTIADKKHLEKAQQKIAEKTTPKVEKTTNWFNRLPRFSKIFFILFLVAISLFVVSLKLKSINTQKKEEANLYQQQINEILTTINYIDRDMVIEFEEGARGKLETAELLLAELPQNTKERRAKYLELKKEIDAQASQLKHVEEISDPIMVFNYGSLDPTVKLSGLSMIDDLVYSFNPDNNVIYQLDPADKTTKTIDKSTFKLGHLDKSLSYDKNTILYLLANKQIAEFDIAQNVIQLADISLSSQEKNIADISTYFGNLYILSPEHNQIYKHQGTESGFGSAKAWVKTELDLSEAVSLAIDGEIFILTAEGQIYRLLKGEVQDFSIKGLDPEFSNPTKIFTDTNTTNLYIVEPEQKRIVVLNKEGKLINQYYSQRFNDLKDILVNEKSGRMYVLNGQVLYAVALMK